MELAIFIGAEREPNHLSGAEDAAGTVWCTTAERKLTRLNAPNRTLCLKITRADATII
jgi:hypothetical protein